MCVYHGMGRKREGTNVEGKVVGITTGKVEVLSIELEVVTLSSDKALGDLALTGGSRHAGSEQGEEGKEVALTHLDECLWGRREDRDRVNW